MEQKQTQPTRKPEPRAQEPIVKRPHPRRRLSLECLEERRAPIAIWGE